MFIDSRNPSQKDIGHRNLPRTKLRKNLAIMLMEKKMFKDSVMFLGFGLD
jgi:hypothetical protein